MKLRPVFILLTIVLVGLMMFGPLGNKAKLVLTKILAPTPTLLAADSQYDIATYEWRLKDKDWNFYSFEEASGKFVFVHFWASWHLPSKATLQGVQAFYEQYNNELVFYLITNEEMEPVKAFMKAQSYDFPVTYRVVGDPTPFKDISLGASYLVSPKGKVLIESLKTSDWGDQDLFDQIDGLLKQ